MQRATLFPKGRLFFALPGGVSKSQSMASPVDIAVLRRSMGYYSKIRIFKNQWLAGIPLAIDGWLQGELGKITRNTKIINMSTDWFLVPLDFQISVHDWYARARQLPQAVLLESHQSKGSRYDIVTALPSCLLISIGALLNKSGLKTGASQNEISNNRALLIKEDQGWQQVDEDPFQLIDQLIKKYRPAGPQPIANTFCGGALGYISYDFGLALHNIPGQAENDIKLPDLIWGIYEWAIIRDNQLEQALLVMSPNLCREKREIIQAALRNSSRDPREKEPEFKVLSTPECNFNRSCYHTAFNKLKNYLQAGDCYQANLARRFATQYEGNPFAIYQAISKEHHSPYSAYLDYAGVFQPLQSSQLQILSFSPEQFLRVENGLATTQPIKGTRPRGKSPAEDQCLASDLQQSQKDMSENLMIVDLLRNDLGQCCEPGSIEVTKLRELETFDNVHHLVSTVKGQLQQDKTPMDLLKACFPGGSITGAPKVRAMQIIDELEPHCRSVYCGTIGYYAFNQLLDCNIAIRTILCKDDHLYFWGGGGIVNDSRADEEYQESQDKIEFIYHKLSQNNR